MSSAKWRPFCLGLNVLIVEIRSQATIRRDADQLLIYIPWLQQIKGKSILLLWYEDHGHRNHW